MSEEELYCEMCRLTCSNNLRPSFVPNVLYLLSFIFDVTVVIVDLLSDEISIVTHECRLTYDSSKCIFLSKRSNHLFDALRLNLTVSNSSSGMKLTYDAQVNHVNNSVVSSDVESESLVFPELHGFRKRYSSNFIFMHNNLNSYRKKYIYLNEILYRNLVDLVFYSETKLDSSYFDGVFDYDGFSLYRQDFSEKSGGLLCQIRSDVPHVRLKDKEINVLGFESLIMKVTIGDSVTVFVGFYKHPFLADSMFKQHFCRLADTLLSSYDDLVFLGDGNCCPKRCSIINDVCDLYGLKNLIDSPTCYKSKSNPTLIDVILVTNPRRYAGTFNSIFSLSDFHNMIGAATKRYAPTQKAFPIHYRSYKKFVNDDFLYDMQSAPFQVAEIFDDVEDAAWYTSCLISNTLDYHAPIKKKWLKKKSPPFMNACMRKAIFKRNMARNLFYKFGKSHWEDFRMKRNTLVSVRENSIQTHFSKNTEKNSKHFWPTVSPFLTSTRKKSDSVISLREGDTIINDPAEVADIFNSYYTKIASDIGFDDTIESVEKCVDKYKNHPSVLKILEHHGDLGGRFSFHTVDSSSVCMYLKQFNPKKATGFDNIPGRILKLAHNELAYPLTYVINSSINQNVFPSILKKAEINPVFKKEDRMVKTNFRPVSILTGISKIFEYVMNGQLYEYFMDIFNAMLSAYRKGYSCQSVLLKLIEDSKAYLDKGMLVGFLMQDLSKAFDCLPHGLLIAKLNAYGVSNSACELVANYLSNRQQRVKIGSSRSKWNDLEKGVPQGSVYGPLLFNIFINDLFYFIERCNLYNFADDNSLSSHSFSLESLMSDLKHDSSICIQWYKDNGMEANPDKFQFMVASSQPLAPVKFNIHEDIVITSQLCVKALGVFIDCQFKFDEHVQQLCSKAGRQLNAFSRLSKYLDVDAKKPLFTCFLMSNFGYCSIIWHFCGKTNNDKIESIQKRGLAIVFNDFDSDYDCLLNRFGTKSIFNLRVDRILVEIYKTLNGKNPSYLNSIFQIKTIPYALRDSSRLCQPMKETTNFGLRSINYVGSKLWNTLPMHLKNSPDVNSFKLGLKERSDVDLNSETFLV